jgi:hypothetical protein
MHHLRNGWKSGNVRLASELDKETNKAVINIEHS